MVCLIDRLGNKGPLKTPCYFLLQLQRENVQISLFLTMVGLCIAVLTLPIISVVVTKKLESFPELWLTVLLSALCQVAIGFFVNYGLSVTNPLYIAVSSTLVMPFVTLINDVRNVSLRYKMFD